MKILSFAIGFLIIVASCQQAPLEKDSIKLKALDRLKSNAAKGDWLAEHHESYISLNDYISKKPMRADSVRKYLYILKLGNFDSVSHEIYNITQAYLQAFFLMSIRLLPDLDVREIPKANQRPNGQIDANYVLDSMLYEVLPADAQSIIALTPIDLYPGNDWNYVFGLASLQKRVGIWSMNRFMKNADDSKGFKKALVRTLHVASHETAHMFGIQHCKVYECNMNGSNSLSELDRQVSWLCHECVAKLCWNRSISTKAHIEALHQFYFKYLPDGVQAEYYQNAMYTLEP